VKINTDINILGGMPELDLIRDYVPNNGTDPSALGASSIRTQKSKDRFENAIKATFFENTRDKLLSLLSATIKAEGISDDCILLLFWIASSNNELLDHINRHVFFPALYSGRATIKPEEVLACLKELKESEPTLRKWSDYTLKLTASKYLTLLKKFKLVDGSVNKTIRHPYLNEKAFVFLIYWMMEAASKTNILESKWFVYSFHERDLFIERIRQNRFSKYLAITFLGDKLKVEPIIDYKDIYNVISKSEPDN
jgi:hypothetical protein